MIERSPRDQTGSVACANLACGSLPSVLHRVHQPQFSVAVWQRPLPTLIHQQMAELCVLMPRQQRFTLRPSCAVEPALDAALSAFLRAPVAASDPWRADLQLLLALARQLAPQAALRVCIETRACNVSERFHVDHVALRLICAYRGQGTQWLPESAIERGGAEVGDCGASVSTLQEIPGGAVAVMKGKYYPGQSGRGLLHRSPAAGADAPRVLAMVDIDLA
jgi:hypothetical protein